MLPVPQLLTTLVDILFAVTQGRQLRPHATILREVTTCMGHPEEHVRPSADHKTWRRTRHSDLMRSLSAKPIHVTGFQR